MGKSSDDGRQFIMLPSALLYALSDTALRIILYAKHRQGLVDIGRLAKWELTLENISNEFEKFKGYSKNTVRGGIQELKALNLIVFKYDHYILNEGEFDKWHFKNSKKGMPNSGKGGLPNSGSGVLPNSGSQEKSNKEKKSSREEKEVSPVPIAPTKAPVSRKAIADSLDEIFPKSKGQKSPVKSLDEQFADMFPKRPGNAAIAPDEIPTVSGLAPKQPAGTTPATDTKQRPNDSEE